MKSITCTCDNVIEADFKDRYDAEEDDNLLDSILSGDFLTVTCGECGKLLKPEFPVRIIGKNPPLDIYFLPEKERDAVLSGKKSLPEANRIVVGYPELEEKVLAAVSGLDDRVLEVLKFYLLNKIEEEKEVSIYLHEAGENSLRFRIHGLKQDEIGIVPVDRKLYDKVLAQIEELEGSEDLGEVLTPPYVSIHKIYLGE
jgi:hypothetical protein